MRPSEHPRPPCRLAAVGLWMLLALLLAPLRGSAQCGPQSTQGTDFWVTFLPNANSRLLTLVATGTPGTVTLLR